MNIGVSNRQWRWFDTIHSFIKWVHNYHLKKRRKKQWRHTWKYKLHYYIYKCKLLKHNTIPLHEIKLLDDHYAKVFSSTTPIFLSCYPLLQNRKTLTHFW